MSISDAVSQMLDYLDAIVGLLPEPSGNVNKLPDDVVVLRNNDGPSVAPSNNRVELDLKITAHTSGSITFQNVIARYQHEST